MASKKKTRHKRQKAIRKQHMDRKYQLESRLKRIKDLPVEKFNDSDKELIDMVISNAEKELHMNEHSYKSFS